MIEFWFQHKRLRYISVAIAGALLGLFVLGCATAPGTTTSGGDGDGTWSYATGPHGESCLFYKYKTLNTGGNTNEGMTMSCVTVKP